MLEYTAMIRDAMIVPMIQATNNSNDTNTTNQSVVVLVGAVVEETGGRFLGTTTGAAGWCPMLNRRVAILVI